MTDLVTELLLALELALPCDRDHGALHAQLERVERAMADAVDGMFALDNDEALEVVA